MLGENYNQMRLIKEGLKPGETIAVDNLQRLRPGQTIVPKMQAPQKVETRSLGDEASHKPTNGKKQGKSKGSVESG